MKTSDTIFLPLIQTELQLPPTFVAWLEGIRPGICPKNPKSLPKFPERIPEAMIAAVKVIFILELFASLKQKKFFKKAL
jgi:hypothetical protein